MDKKIIVGIEKMIGEVEKKLNRIAASKAMREPFTVGSALSYEIDHLEQARKLIQNADKALKKY